MQIKISPQDDFDLALQQNRQPNTEFVLQKGGTYFTKGSWYYKDYKTLAPKCKLFGEGARLILSPNAERSVAGTIRPDKDLNVLWADDSCIISNLIIDGNEKAFRNSDPLNTWYVTTGLRGFGGQYITNVTVENIRGEYNPVGTLSSQIESFAFSTIGASGGTIIKNCVVQSCPADSYVSSFNIGHVGPVANMNQNLVSDCRVDIEKGNWLAFGVNCKVSIKNCTTNGNKIAIYNDTSFTEEIIVDKCVFNNVEKLLSMVIPTGSNHYKKNIWIKNSKINYTLGPARHLVELWDKNTAGQTQLGPVLIQDCVITQDAATTLYVATVGADVRPITIVNTPVSNLVNMAKNQLSIF